MKAVALVVLVVLIVIATVAAYAPQGTTTLTPGQTQTVYCAAGTLVVTLQRTDEIRLACRR